MNDFSKEELMSLHEFLDDACNHYLEPVYIYDLRDKIKAMIDNYCVTQSTKCPKCTNMRVADGMCWNIGCDYREY